MSQMSLLRFVGKVSSLTLKGGSKFATRYTGWISPRITCGLHTVRAEKMENEVATTQQANWKARVELAAAYRAFEMLDFNEGTCNHLSTMAPAISGQGLVMLVTPQGIHWKEITASRLVGLNEAGEVVEGEGEVETSAISIHMGVHREKPGATCVFHLHPPYATAIGCLKGEVFGMYHQNACRFFDDFSYDRDYSGFALEVDEGARLAKQLGSNRVLFMCNHGVLVVGANVAEVFDDFYYLERTCMNQGLAMQMGREVQEIPEEICRTNKSSHDQDKIKYYPAHFNAYKRILAKQNPNFAS